MSKLSDHDNPANDLTWGKPTLLSNQIADIKTGSIRKTKCTRNLKARLFLMTLFGLVVVSDQAFKKLNFSKRGNISKDGFTSLPESNTPIPWLKWIGVMTVLVILTVIVLVFFVYILLNSGQSSDESDSTKAKSTLKGAPGAQDRQQRYNRSFFLNSIQAH